MRGLIRRREGGKRMEKNKDTPQARYSKKYLKKYMLEFNMRTDADILEFFQSVPNKRQLLLTLLREEMERVENSR